MPDERYFEELRDRLLRGGVATVYLERALLELAEHREDLENDALAAGWSGDEAARIAWRQLGSCEAIAAAILAQRDLLDFDHRWPRVAVCLRSVAGVGALPGFCADHGGEIARWGGAICSASLLMGSLCAWLNWMITLT
jgi:hypothetical protein